MQPKKGATMQRDRQTDDVGARDFRFAMTGMALIIAIAAVATILSQL